MSSSVSSAATRSRPSSNSGDITIITTTRHINSQPPTPTLASPVTSPTTSTLPRTLSARSLPQVNSPSATAPQSSGWWGAVASTVKFLSSLAVEDESPAPPVTPTATQTRFRKVSPPVSSSVLSSTSPLTSTAAPLRESVGLSRGRSGTALPGLPRPVHVQSHAHFPGTAAPVVTSRSVSVPSTPQHHIATFASLTAASPLTPPISPVAEPSSSAPLHPSPLPASTKQSPSRSHTTSALTHPSPSKRSQRDDSNQLDSLSTSPALPAPSHRRSVSLSHMGSLSLSSSSTAHAAVAGVQKTGVMLEAYKPVQADTNRDAIEAEMTDDQWPQTGDEMKEADSIQEDASAAATTPSPTTDALTTPPPHSHKGVNGTSTPTTDLSPSSSAPSPSHSPKSAPSDHRRNVRLLHFQRLLNEQTLDLSALRSLAWNGVPAECRADVWRLLLGYLPLSKARRESMLDKRRQEYITFLRQHYLTLSSSPAASLDTETLNQIQQDVPRTSPAYLFFKRPAIQKSLERVLFIFSIRHPASGYVQGMNDLVTPFYCVMLDAAVSGGGEMVLSGGREDDARVSEAVMLAVEADCYWCLSSFLDAVQDHYTFAQPGIQRCVYRLSSLVQSLNPSLHAHLESEQVSFMHFAFRWMNCLLMREMSLPCTVRLFDTYIASSSTSSGGLSSFASFHVYVCTAFLLQWSKQLTALDFQDLILFLQRPPTERWTVRDVEGLIAQAYVFQAWEDKGGGASGGAGGSVGGVDGDGGGSGKGLLVMNGLS